MAAVALLVFAGPNRLRYLITGDEVGGVATIANDAGASPDLQTDVVAGPLRAIARARLDGLGILPAGALTQAEARAALLSDPAADLGNAKVPRAICRTTARNGTAAVAVDANVDGGGDPIIEVTVAADQIAYLDVEVANASGIAGV